MISGNCYRLIYYAINLRKPWLKKEKIIHAYHIEAQKLKYIIILNIFGNSWKILGLRQLLSSFKTLLPPLLGEASSIHEAVFEEENIPTHNEEFAKERDIHCRAFLYYTYLLTRLGCIFEKESINK